MPLISYLYWDFACEQCSKRFDYAYLGVAGETNLMGIPNQQSFQFRCPNCGKQHIYSHLDLKILAKHYSPRPDDIFVGELPI